MELLPVSPWILDFWMFFPDLDFRIRLILWVVIRLQQDLDRILRTFSFFRISDWTQTIHSKDKVKINSADGIRFFRTGLDLGIYLKDRINRVLRTGSGNFG